MLSLIKLFCLVILFFFFFFFQAEDGIRDAQESRGLGDVYKRQGVLQRIESVGNCRSNRTATWNSEDANASRNAETERAIIDAPRSDRVTRMTHEEAFSELSAVALDTAPADVANAVRAHAQACPECGPELAAMEQTIALVGQLVPSAQINRGRSAGIRSRLLMRARAERESRSAPIPGPPDIARGVASLTGQGQRITPSCLLYTSDAADE